MKSVLTADQAYVYAYLKKARSCKREDIQRDIGISPGKLNTALQLFFVVDKIAEVSGVLYYCESPLPVALRNAIAQTLPNAAPSEPTRSEPTCVVTPAQDLANEVAISPTHSFDQVMTEVQDKRRPSSLGEVVDFLKTLSGDLYSYISSPGTDYESTAQQFINYMDAKGWRFGKAPLKDWRAAVRRYAADAQNHWIVRKFQGFDNGFVTLDAERDQRRAAPASVEGYTLVEPPVQQLPPPAPVTRVTAPMLPPVQAQVVEAQATNSNDWAAQDYQDRRKLIEAKYAALYGAAPNPTAPAEEIEAYNKARNEFIEMVMRDCEHMTYSELFQLDLSNWAAAS